MSNKLIVPALLVAALAAGCTASATGTVGANTSPSAMPSGGTNTTVGGNTNVGTGMAAGYYAVGRKWVYNTKNVTNGQTMTGTYTNECTAIENGMATLKTTITGGPTGTISATGTVKVDQLPSASSDGKMPEGVTLTDKGAESVTVPAGTYADAHKYTSMVSNTSADTTTDTWANASVGLIKSVSTIKPKTGSMPSVPGLPAGSLDFTSTYTLELASFTP